MPHAAKGTFTVDLKPLTPTPAEGIKRYSIHKQIQGDLQATTQGEMFAAGNPQTGHAGYVAIEVVTGSLAGKGGSFALEHMGTMDANGPQLTVVVVPGSGTGALTGLSGTFQIVIEDGKHTYELSYDLPA